MSIYGLEDNVTWNELAPSLQELFKGLQVQIDKEKQEREAEDQKLWAALNKEIADRQAADAAEAAARAAADAAEAAARQAADAAEASARAAGDAAEANARNNEDQALWAAINQLKKDLKDGLDGITTLVNNSTSNTVKAISGTMTVNEGTNGPLPIPSGATRSKCFFISAIAGSGGGDNHHQYTQSDGTIAGVHHVQTINYLSIYIP